MRICFLLSITIADDGKADVWSLGITLYELCTGNPPHFSVSPLRAIFLISSKPAPKLPAKRASHISAAGEMKELDWSEELKDFIGLCLKKDSSKRSTAQELLDHPFIADYVSVINDNESSNTHGYDSDSSGDFEEEETHGLSVLIDLVEENLPALTEKWMGKENNKSKRCESELEKKLSIKSSAVATVRVNRADSFSPRSLSLVQPSSSAVERRPSMDLQWSTPRKSGKAAIGFNSEIVSQHSDQKLSSDDEWMYGLEADSSQSASLYSSVTKREPINLADTFQRKPSMGDKSPQSCRTSFIATTPRENMSNKGANIQSALKCFKETEDCLTAKKLAALPPLDRTLSSPRTLLSPRTIHLAGDLHGSLKHDGSLTPPGRRRLSETSSVGGKVRKSLTPPSRRQSNASTPDDKARKSLTPPCRRQSDASYTSEKARNSLTPPSRRQSIASAISEKVRNSLTPPSRRQSIASATSEKVRNSLTPPSRRQSDASSTSEKARNSLTPPSRRQSIASAISEKVRNSLTPPTGRRLSDPATVSDKGRRNLIPPGRRLSDPASVVEKARESKTFFLTALDATQRPSTYLEAFSANEPLDFMHNPYNSSAGIASKNGTGIASKTGTGIASKRGTGSVSKAGSKSLSGTGTGTGTASGASTVCVSGIGIGVDSKAGCRTSQVSPLPFLVFSCPVLPPLAFNNTIHQCIYMFATLHCTILT